MNKQESYKTYMILMISSDGNQNNVFLFLFTTDHYFVMPIPQNVQTHSKNLSPICRQIV